jgi:hypothetical protein
LRREDRRASDTAEYGDGNFTTGMKNSPLARQTCMMPRIVRIYLRAYTSIHAPTVARMCGSAAHLPTIPGGVPLRRSSRCNCVNCTTHMIRIAFNYSPICEILPLPSLRRALYLVSSPCAQRVQRARAMRVRAFDDNER